MYPDPGETIVIVTAAPTKLAMNVSRQQSGKGTVGTTDVGATLYSVPASITETVTGPGCARAGVKVNEQVGGCPIPELEDQGGGAIVHVGSVAVNVNPQKESFAPTLRDVGATLYLPALCVT